MSSVVTVPTPTQSPYAATVDSAGRILLAPLQGLSFSEMEANGEGARHAGDPNYYRLILLHALFGAFAFLVFTPAAIICARFLIHGPRPRLAMFGHIGFQIASVICLTITFITGYFAVDRGSWGKNPHHIIGATLYGGMLFQVFFGTFVRWRVHLKIRTAPPLYKMLHQWLGRALAMLGMAQIPIGLYVYGSPKALFVLYAIVAFLFLLSWFILEYLRNRGWFDSRFRGQPTPVPEMSEHNSEVRRSPSDVEPGYRRVGMDETPVQTPKKSSRFSSWFGRRNSQKGVETIGIPYHYDGTTSMDTSRAPSAQSLAIGGLAPGPGRQGEIPPVPALPAHYENQHSSSSLPSVDFQQRYGNPTGLKDTVLRDSTTLGPRPGHTPLEMPEPQIPQSPLGQYGQYPAPALGANPRSSGHSRRNSRSYQQPPPGRLEQMPSSPMGSGGYVEAENGFVPTPAEGSPGRPLPLPPHRRDRSTDSGNRLPIAQSPEQYASEGQTIMVGGGAEGSQRGQANVAVQVKLNPDGKSVTVRRLPAEEAERERRERSRARQERALQREMEIERERQARRPQSSRQPRQGTMDSVDRSERGDDRPELRSPTTSYTPSISGQSTTIAGASGGLLGRGGDVQTPTPSNDLGPLNAMSPLIGMQPVTRSPIPAGALSSSQRASVTSGTGTAENSEIEQEIIKEQRRRKRREERAGTSQGGGSAADGGYYGPKGPESQWT